ncbi:Cell division protein ZapE [Sinobacterium norvegicum]|uniref:Cell division protein ZapE n=1 Tax=Sinobacterium norvegicum TaxID=1641715 RepID=A0ABM9AJD1_9GAMM|nr:cell division protein ZapE [Sinobacterium norvegicum]CAH0993345.1 Cell division protein ZapE [Sinobacterium norvegicum]
MTPLERYKNDLQTPGFNYDASQENAVKHLQRLYDELLASEAVSGGGLSVRLKSLFGRQQEPAMVKGLYFWGGVGRGKTYLMDNFYDSLPFEQKQRTHFHRFMRDVHHQLTELQGEKNPLEKVADGIAKKARIICFDEFFVSDITDAMILGGLFEALFARGVVLLATSNIIPDGLYKNGLQRSRFLPAIKLLNERTEIINVDGGVDYRLRTLEQAELFHHPLDEAAELSLASSFTNLAPDHEHCEADVDIEIEGRNIRAKRVGDDVAWFDFYAICDGPRSQNDYIELAKEFHAVLISNVPEFQNKDDLARRFINLVDEFYDRGVKVVLSAAVPLGELYSSGKLSFEFERTISRLLEMQSHEYLAREHKP